MSENRRNDIIHRGAEELGNVNLVEGIGEDYIPSICHLDHVKEAYTITDKTAFSLIRTLLKQTGIFAGSSTRVLLGAAIEYCQKQTTSITGMITIIWFVNRNNLPELWRSSYKLWLCEV